MRRLDFRGTVDCHAHVFPDWRLSARAAMERLPESVSEPVGQVARGLIGLAKQVESVFAKQTPSQTSIERVAALHETLSPHAQQRLEYALSTVGSGPTMMRGTVRRLLESMERNGIDQTIVIATHEYAENRWLLNKAVPQAPDKLLPVCIVPKELGEDAPLEEWLEVYEDLALRGARGFKIHPNADDKAPEHLAYRALFEIAEEHGLFVIVHTGYFAVSRYRDTRPAEPTRFTHLFSAHPNVRVCLAHMNRAHPEPTWEVMRAHENVFTDTSWQPPEAITRALKVVDKQRILLGSDWPLLHPQLQDEALTVLERAARQDDLEAICVENARRFLGQE